MAKEFDVDRVVDEFRRVMKLRDLAKSVAERERLDAEGRRLRDVWKGFSGDDDLYETAFGEPFDEHGDATA